MIEKRTKNRQHLFNQKNFPIINKLRATAGPIPKANNKVPTPTVPPKYQPIDITVISRKALTIAIGKFVFFVNQPLVHLLVQLLN